jgi:hypothetical protein
MTIQPFADAQAAFPFVLGQGRNIETTIYTRRYPTFNYAATVPVVTEGNEWGIGTTFFTVDTAGEAKFISGAANDMPFNSATHDQASHDFAMIGSGWEWNLEEVNQASIYGYNLENTKALSAADKIERLLNSIAMIGTTEKGWTGFANNGGVVVTTAPADGAGGLRTAASKTVDQILRDLNSVLSSIRTTTSEVEWADTLRIPPALFRYLSTLRMGAGDGFITLLEYFRRNNIYTAETGQALDIAPLRELATAGAGGVSRTVAYRKDPEVLRFHLPMPRKVLTPRQKSIMAFETGIIARTGGTEVRLPGAMAYLDGL